jgi:hypothetical protein
MPQPKPKPSPKPNGLYGKPKPKVEMVKTETGKVISKAENDFRKKSSDAAMNAQFFSRPEYANKEKAKMFQKSADENWRKADSSKEANKAEVKQYIAKMAMKKKK